MKKKYKTEIEGMRDFYEELGIEPTYSCNTDGNIKGTLVEFKLNNKEGIPMKQFKRYINAFNCRALPIPLYSLYININQRKFSFINNKTWEIIKDGNWKTPKDLLKFLNKDEYKKGWIEEYSIVAYNDEFYKKHISAKKEDFILEIKNPKELNIEPYRWDDTGDMERSILDCLGGKELKKRLGAFFTPDEYVKISTEYLRNAIKSVPDGYDYIILDRCAGTGNLQKFLTDEEASHCILNTYVYAEWTTLKGVYEDRVRYIIPHTRDNKDTDGLLTDGDALTEKFDILIKMKIAEERKKANDKLIVIGLENPPYVTAGSEATRSGKTHKQASWIKEQMKLAHIIKGDAGSDLCNHFIWSMLRYADEYIIFSPIKYWKSQHLLDEKFNNGYLCNREKFHATESAISLIHWSINKKLLLLTEKIKNNSLDMQSDLGNRKIKKIFKGASVLLPNSKNRLVNKCFAGIILRNGTPSHLNGHLVNKVIKHDEGRVRKLNKANIRQLNPLWVANCYIPKNYTEMDTIMKSGDGGIKYQKDGEFLDDCFLWSCLSNQNKCISEKKLRNELCLNQDTEADEILNINEKHTNLLQTWKKIIDFIKTTKEYNKKYTYGLHQIIKEINIKIETKDTNKKGEAIMEYKYSELNELIKELKILLKEFFDKNLSPKLFKYELLK